MSSKNFGRVAALSVVIAAALVGGMAGSRAFNRPSGATSAIANDYSEALDLVSANYADEVNYDKAGEGAIQGMLTALDPHSNFFSQAEYRRLLQDQESRFTGIGVSILRHRDGVYVQTPLEGTPAAKAGLRFGDRIVEVDGKDAREWTTQEVSKAVRGPEGERVTLKIERAGALAPLFFTVERAYVPQPSVRNTFMIRPGVGYVGLTGGFTKTTGGELKKALDDLSKEGARQIVLDLRNNPGGLLPESINVASHFIPRGETVVSVRGRDAGRGDALRERLDRPGRSPARRAHQPQLGLRLRDRRRRDTGSRARPHRRRDLVRQGPRAESLPAPPGRGPDADDREVLHALRSLDSARLLGRLALRLLRAPRSRTRGAPPTSRRRPSRTTPLRTRRRRPHSRRPRRKPTAPPSRPRAGASTTAAAASRPTTRSSRSTSRAPRARASSRRPSTSSGSSPAGRSPDSKATA